MRFVRPLFGLLLIAAPSVAFAQTAGATKPTAPSTMAPPGSTPPSTMAPATGTSSSMSGPGTSASAPGSTGGGTVTHYTSASDATSKCGSDTVVWANPRSKALHASGSKHFGKTKSGFYACEKDAMAGGYHMAGTMKHKKKASS